MRVVAGSVGGIRLTGPGRLSSVRPTSDRVRESLFAVLGERVEDRIVLDAFAGCGTLGVEALSRGARRCVFVEQDPRCRRIIAENLAHTRLAHRARVLSGDAYHCAERLPAEEGPFGLLFFDPPYRCLHDPGGWERLFTLLRALVQASRTSRDAVFVVEHAARDRPSEPPPGLLVSDRRRYGDTALLFLASEPADAPGAG